MGLLSGLSGLGLDGLADADVFDGDKKGEDKKKAQAVKIEEKDLLFDKTYKCPVCGDEAYGKVMKSGKAKLLGTDQDLRPRYDGIDIVKYDVVLCPNCGYTALARFFPNLTSTQAKMITEQISSKVKIPKHTNETYTYEEAIDRYQLALANAVVKRAKASEKAYICLKSAWLMRGYAEYQKEQKIATDEAIAELRSKEEEYILNAYNGFVEARQSEGFPMCGMDEVTVDYLLAVLSFHLKKYDVASKMVGTILTNTKANNRMKDKARDLKDEILAEMKKNK